MDLTGGNVQNHPICNKYCILKESPLYLNNSKEVFILAVPLANQKKITYKGVKGKTQEVCSGKKKPQILMLICDMIRVLVAMVTFFGFAITLYRGVTG